MDPDAIRSAKEILSIKYIRILRMFMLTVGAWPSDAVCEDLVYMPYLRKLFPLISVMSSCGQTIFLIKYHDSISFFMAGHCYITMFLAYVSTIRTSLPSFTNYKKLAKKFFLSFHLVHFRSKGPYYEKIYIIIDKVSYYYTVFMIILMAFATNLFNISPIYQNYRNGVFVHRDENTTILFSLYYSFPGINANDWFKTVTLANFPVSYLCGVCVCSIDALLCNMVFQIIGHIFILRNNLENLSPNKTPENVNRTSICEMYNAEENQDIHIKLSHIIGHHKLIVSFAGDMSSFFGPVLAINYLFHLVGCCLLLLECSRGDAEALIQFVPMTLIIYGQLIQISCVFEAVGSMSEKIIDAVYQVPWEFMNTRNRRTVCILLYRVQTPITVTALGMASVGVATMTGILKTSFSYFAFLKSMG